MLDFCPFDFNKIDMNNLAYELVFADEWTWERVKNETVIGTDTKPFINENDDRRNIHYKDREDKKFVEVQHVVLLENRNPRGKNGFQQLLELISARNGYEADKREYKDMVENDTDNISGGGYGSINLELSISASGSNENTDKISLEYRQVDGIDTFFDEYNNEVMYAMPCCPYCHNRLPIGWREAEDFGAVSLMAPTFGGKTTFLYSMMNKNWSVFRNYRFSDGKRLYIKTAHWPGDPTDTSYASMQAESDEMCRNYGKCPPNTQKDRWIPPAFLNIQFEGHVLILGIYDNAGENLQKGNPHKKTNLKMLLNKMFAEIYLFDPGDLNLSLTKEKKKRRNTQSEILTIEEQGKMQKEQANTVIRVSSILNENESGNESGNEEKFQVLEVFDNMITFRTLNNMLDQMQNMYFIATLIKCDLLENVTDIAGNNKYNVLLKREAPDRVLNINQMIGRSDTVREMFEELDLFGGRYRVEDLEGYYGDGKSFWHCVSALGCDAEIAGTLKGSYTPIRVADPLLTCIVRRVADNGWL